MITEFLLARIAEDEADAATMQRWIVEMNANPPSVYDQEYPPDVAFTDPARVLAECEAKRRIVALHEPFVPYSNLGVKCETCADNPEADYDGTPMVEWPCPTLRALTAVHADHPDFDPAWRA